MGDNTTLTEVHDEVHDESSQSLFSESSISNKSATQKVSDSSLIKVLIDDADNITGELKEILLFLTTKIKLLEAELINEKKNNVSLRENFSQLDKNYVLLNCKVEKHTERLHTYASEIESLKLHSNIFEAKNNKLISDIQAEITTLYKKTLETKEEINLVNEDIDKIADDIYDLQCCTIKMDQYSRRENLIIHGIPSHVDQSHLQENVLEILKRIGLGEVTPFEISACHRLKKKKSNSPAPTIVRFTNRKIVEYCIKHKERLNDKRLFKTNIRFYENLCKQNEMIVNKCTYMVAKEQIFDYKIVNGNVSVIVHEGDRPFKIFHPDDFYELIENSGIIETTDDPN